MSGKCAAMNGKQADETAAAAAAAGNPFASPAVLSAEANGSAFDSPAGGGAVFGDSPDPFASAAAAAAAAVAASQQDGDGALGEGEQFKQASPSIFEQSVPSPSTPVGGEADFMANQEAAWINQEGGANSGKGTH